jgi:hypothetical protein
MKNEILNKLIDDVFFSNNFKKEKTYFTETVAISISTSRILTTTAKNSINIIIHDIKRELYKYILEKIQNKKLTNSSIRNEITFQFLKNDIYYEPHINHLQILNYYFLEKTPIIIHELDVIKTEQFYLDNYNVFKIIMTISYSDDFNVIKMLTQDKDIKLYLRKEKIKQLKN